jgi:hypothetical protein
MNRKSPKLTGAKPLTDGAFAEIRPQATEADIPHQLERDGDLVRLSPIGRARFARDYLTRRARNNP